MVAPLFGMGSAGGHVEWWRAHAPRQYAALLKVSTRAEGP